MCAEFGPHVRLGLDAYRDLDNTRRAVVGMHTSYPLSLLFSSSVARFYLQLCSAAHRCSRPTCLYNARYSMLRRSPMGATVLVVQFGIVRASQVTFAVY